VGIVEGLEYIAVARLPSIEEVADGAYRLLLAACLIIDDTGDILFVVNAVDLSAK
jgi:hypothetical protein